MKRQLGWSVFFEPTTHSNSRAVGAVSAIVHSTFNSFTINPIFSRIMSLDIPPGDSDRFIESKHPKYVDSGNWYSMVSEKGSIDAAYDVYEDKVLGSGCCAIVNLGKDKHTREYVAVKRVRFTSSFSQSKARIKAFQTEVEVLERLGHHPNIARLYDVFIGEAELNLVLQLIPGGDLFERIVSEQHIPEPIAKNGIKSICSALEFIHRHGITHRDMKPENIMLSDKKSSKAQWYITDFGLSSFKTVMRTKCGTWAYCAPEVRTRASYTSKIDMWSIGVIMYSCLGGFHPFDPCGESEDTEVFRKSCNVDYSFEDEVWQYVSEEAKSLIEHLLVLDPKERLTAGEVLNHPWITGGDSYPEEMLHIADQNEPGEHIVTSTSFVNKKNGFKTLVENTKKRISSGFLRMKTGVFMKKKFEI